MSVKVEVTVTQSYNARVVTLKKKKTSIFTAYVRHTNMHIIRDEKYSNHSHNYGFIIQIALLRVFDVIQASGRVDTFYTKFLQKKRRKKQGFGYQISCMIELNTSLLFCKVPCMFFLYILDS